MGTPTPGYGQGEPSSADLLAQWNSATGGFLLDQLGDRYVLPAEPQSTLPADQPAAPSAPPNLTRELPAVIDAVDAGRHRRPNTNRHIGLWFIAALGSTAAGAALIVKAEEVAAFVTTHLGR